MKLLVPLAIFCATGASALCPPNRKWIAPTSTDRRSPCPMLNSLANHGFLARDGRNVSMADLTVALHDAVHLAPAATALVGQMALLTSTTGNNATFNLDDLSRHGFIEHDGSLSRNDIYFGDNHSFNTTIWNSVAAAFTNSTISLPTAISARADRLAAAAAVNPTFNLTATGMQFSGMETAIYLIVFADPKSPSEARTRWVRVFFGNERLPYEEGWVRSEEELTLAAVLGLTTRILSASPAVSRA